VAGRATVNSGKAVLVVHYTTLHAAMADPSVDWSAEQSITLSRSTRTKDIDFTLLMNRIRHNRLFVTEKELYKIILIESVGMSGDCADI